MSEIDKQREATAYHEAAHTVLAYWLGWRLSPGGVRFGDDPMCSCLSNTHSDRLNCLTARMSSTSTAVLSELL